MIFPSFKQIARRLSRVERICETKADDIFDELLFDRDMDVGLETATYEREDRLDAFISLPCCTAR